MGMENKVTVCKCHLRPTDSTYDVRMGTRVEICNVTNKVCSVVHMDESKVIPWKSAI